MLERDALKPVQVQVDQVLGSSERAAVCAGTLMYTGVRVHVLRTPEAAQRIAEDLTLSPWTHVLARAVHVRLASGERLPQETLDAEKDAEQLMAGGAMRLTRMLDNGGTSWIQPRGDSPMDRYRGWLDYRAPGWLGDYAPRSGASVLLLLMLFIFALFIVANLVLVQVGTT